MAALPPSADVFHLERRRLEEAAADLRSLLAEKNEQLSEQCAKCAHEEEKLLRSKYLAEFEEISLQKDALKAKLEKNTSDLEHQEMDLNRAEERKKAVEEYQSHLRLTEGTKNDLVARISQLKAKQRGATESLKSQMCHVLEAHQKEEAKLSQKLRGQEEALARNEACATADVLQGMTPQESLAADLKHQLSASQEKVATLEASVESMQALSFQKEMRVEEMIEACDTALKQKALQRDIAEKEATELQKGEQSVKAATLEIERLQEADALAKDLQEKLHTSGGDIFLVRLIFPHIFVWGSCFWICIPSAPPPSSSARAVTHNLSHTTLSHTHNLSHTTLSHIIFRIQLCHTHTIFHIQICHAHNL